MPSRPDWELSAGTQITANAVFFSTAAAVLVYALYVARKDRALWPLYLFVAAGVCVFYETIIDHLGAVTYGEQNLTTVYHLWDREIPLYILGVYITYFGLAATWLMRALDRGVTERQWWKYYWWHVVVCFAFEPIPIHFDLWKYWGDNQPFGLFGFPAWWWFANGAMLYNATAIMYLVRRHLIADRHSFILILLYPAAIFAIHGSAAIPVGLALNSTTNQLVIEVAQIVTIAVAFMYTWLFGKAVTGAGARREPMQAPSLQLEYA